MSEVGLCLGLEFGFSTESLQGSGLSGCLLCDLPLFYSSALFGCFHLSNSLGSKQVLHKHSTVLLQSPSLPPPHSLTLLSLSLAARRRPAFLCALPLLRALTRSRAIRWAWLASCSAFCSADSTSWSARSTLRTWAGSKVIRSGGICSKSEKQEHCVHSLTHCVCGWEVGVGRAPFPAAASLQSPAAAAWSGTD